MDSTAEKTVVKIAHISDIHMSENIEETIGDRLRMVNMFGHNILALAALTDTLNDLDLDIIVVSGDVSRNGNKNALAWAKTWLEEAIAYGDYNIGLHLNQKNKPYIIVPGNHDRFNGKKFQQDRDLENYNQVFGQMPKEKRLSVKGIEVLFSLFDSTTDDGSPALGYIQPQQMVGRHRGKANVNIAVVHHHIAQPPNHHREPQTEIKNEVEALLHFVDSDYDAIMFGHTHKCYAELLPVRLFQRNAKYKKRPYLRWLRRILPFNFISKRRMGEPLDGVSYSREKTRDGKYPSFEYYLRYLYIKEVMDKTVSGPRDFENVKHFYRHIDSIENDFDKRYRELLSRRCLLSMAPSAAQAEAELNGFVILEFNFVAKQLKDIIIRRFAHQGGNRYKEV